MFKKLSVFIIITLCLINKGVAQIGIDFNANNSMPTILLPISKVNVNKGGTYEFYFYIHLLAGFSANKAQIILLDSSNKSKNISYNITKINRIAADSLGNTTVAYVVADSTLVRHVNKNGSKRLGILITQEKEQNFIPSTITTLIKNGTILYETSGRHFFSFDNVMMDNFTQEKQDAAMQAMVNECKLYAYKIKNTTQDITINKGTYIGLKQSELLELTDITKVDQYLIYLTTEKQLYATQYICFIPAYLNWINEGAFIDIRKF